MGEILFSTEQSEVLRRATARELRQEGPEHFLGMQTLVWQEDFVGPRMPSNLDRLQPLCRNVFRLHLGGTRDVLLGSSQCPWPAHLQAGCRTSHPCTVTWIYQNEPHFKTSETTERNPLASSDDRAKGYCSGPASFRFLTGN